MFPTSSYCMLYQGALQPESEGTEYRISSICVCG